jgi:Flp pilus assembly protein TadD
LIDVAKILLQLGASDDAYQVAQHLGTLEIQAWGQLRDLALVMNQTGHPDEALPFAEKALELAPENQREGVQDLVAALQAQTNP